MVRPSIIACPFVRWKDELESMESIGIDTVHLDVMDGHFVPNMTFGMMVVEGIRKWTDLKLDTHVMISNPSKYLKAFWEAGADIITFHVETGREAFESMEIAKKYGIAVGVAMNPKTHPRFVEPFLGDVEQVIVMTVEPGFSGQRLIEEVLYKVSYLKHLKLERNLKFKIVVDGGVNRDNLGRILELGSDAVVMGKGFFELSHEERSALLLYGS